MKKLLYIVPLVLVGGLLWGYMALQQPAPAQTLGDDSGRGKQTATAMMMGSAF